jgi:hypothetical protein
MGAATSDGSVLSLSTRTVRHFAPEVEPRETDEIADVSRSSGYLQTDTDCFTKTGEPATSMESSLPNTNPELRPSIQQTASCPFEK